MKLTKTNEYRLRGDFKGYIYRIVEESGYTFSVIHEYGDAGGWRYFPSGKQISVVRHPHIVECIKKSEYESFDERMKVTTDDQ